MDNPSPEKQKGNALLDRRKKTEVRAQDVVFNIFNYLFFAVFTLTCIFPFYYIFINTISSNEYVRTGAITLLPKGLTISNYIAMGNVHDLWNSFFITIMRTVIGTALSVLSSALAGYLMTKNQLWQKKIWYRAIVITMYFNAGLIPLYPLTGILTAGATRQP